MSSKSLALSFSLLTTLSIATGTARADQCAWNTEPIARKAAALVQRGAEVVELCEPCKEERPGASRKVGTSKVTRPAKDYFALSLDGKEVDLAYLFVKTESNVYTNVGVLAGCEPEDVSTEIRDGKPTGFRAHKPSR